MDRNITEDGQRHAATVAELLAYVRDRTGEPDWTADRDLFDGGHLTSLFAVQLVGHLESAYDLTIDSVDLVPDNFRTVHNMADYVSRQR